MEPTPPAPFTKHRRPGNNGKPRAYFAQIRDRARRNDIVFTITFQDFLDTVNATGYLEKRGRQSFNLHLDRRDALKGYERGNLRVITAGENCSKGATEDKERRAAFVAQRLGFDPSKKPQPEPEPEEPYHEPTENEPF